MIIISLGRIQTATVPPRLSLQARLTVAVRRSASGFRLDRERSSATRSKHRADVYSSLAASATVTGRAMTGPHARRALSDARGVILHARRPANWNQPGTGGAPAHTGKKTFQLSGSGTSSTVIAYQNGTYDRVP